MNVFKTNNSSKDNEDITPFEWLTNSSSLLPLLSPRNLFREDSVPFNKSTSSEVETTKRSALHIGCGSSILGEHLALYLGYSPVVNIDNDIDTLVKMEKRWEKLERIRKATGDGRNLEMKFKYIDLSKQPCESPSADCIAMHDKRCFDLIIDKSTLDCALCSENTAAGLIKLAHDNLIVGGAYVVVTFHAVEYILPLLRDCPGVSWKVTHSVMERKHEKISESNYFPISGDSNGYSAGDLEKLPIGVEQNSNVKGSSGAWSKEAGTFDPTSSYGKHVNIFICRLLYAKSENNMDTQQPSKNHELTSQLDYNAVSNHIRLTCDSYFREVCPMLTHVRKDALRNSFLKSLRSLKNVDDSTNRNDDHIECILQCTLLPLEDCYDILFTREEKEILSYDLFLEDWDAFLKLQNSNEILQRTSMNIIKYDHGGMSYYTALKFLNDMQ